jgi:hypothetical protein
VHAVTALGGTAKITTLLSVAVTVKVKLPAVVGVPDKTPPLDRDRPGGREPLVTAKVYGAVPPEAVNVWL